MRKFPVFELAVFVIGLAGSIYLAFDLSQKRIEPYKINTKERASQEYFPFLGIDKFWADVEWMECINYMGSSQSPKSPDMMNYIKSKFDVITDLDPDFNKVYLEGCPFIWLDKMDETLALIDKGQKYSNKKDWNRNKLAAYYLLSQARTKVAAKPDDEAVKKEADDLMDKAQKYLEKAIDEGGDWPVVSMLLHTETRKSGVYGSPYEVEELAIWNNYLIKQLKELTAKAVPEMDASGNPVPRIISDKASDMMNASMSLGGSSLERVRERILERSRKIMQDLIQEENTAIAVNDEAGVKRALERQKTVRTIYRDLENQGHFAMRSLANYDAGDIFDATTGDPIEPYGIDLYDLEVNNRITPIKGPFNYITGKPVAENFAALEKMLKDEGKSITKLSAHHPDVVNKFN